MTSSRINTILKNRKNKNKKGFSLVELIVVLVIMAILAAALVPTLIGYIQQSRQSNVKNEAAACVQAAQVIASYAYAASDSTYIGQGSKAKIVIEFKKDANATVKSGDINAEIIYLADLKDVTGASVSNVVIDKNLVVSELTYTHGDTTVKYKNGNYSIS